MQREKKTGHRGQNKSGPFTAVRWLSASIFSSWLVIGGAFAQTPAVTPSPFDWYAEGISVHAAGQSATLLPDGRWLLLGGATSGKAAVPVPLEDQSGAVPKVQILQVALLHARSGHSATVLPDGSVLVLGGADADGKLVADAELLDVQTQTVKILPDTGLTPRTRHTATLLTNGLVLIAGGLSATGTPVELSELYNPATQKAEPFVAALQSPRSDHQAALLANGKGLLWGGKDAAGKPLERGELYDPTQMRFSGVDWWDEVLLPARELTAIAPKVEDSLPKSAATDVPVDSRIAVRFSKPLHVQSINDGSVTLVGPAGAVSGKAIAAEAGLLAFFTPSADLSPDTTYTLFLNGLTDSAGGSLPFSSFSFTTHRFRADEPGSGKGAGGKSGKNAESDPSSSKNANRKGGFQGLALLENGQQVNQSLDDQKNDDEDDGSEDWIPSEQNRHGNWQILGLVKDPVLHTNNALASRFQAAIGSTALSGQIARLNGRPLVGVPVSVGNQSVLTDANGGFLLSGLSGGIQTLKVDGTAVVSAGRHYTKHFIQVNLQRGKTTAMPGTIFLPRVDPTTEVAIASPSDREIVLTHPAIPGLEVRIPKGAVLREYDGKLVTKLSITPIPVDRAPYPAPINFSVYFTLQPGGAFVDGDPSKTVKIIYPNYQGLAPSTSVNFWNYDPNGGGWKVYSQGKVSADGKKIVPDKGVGFRQIMTFGFGIGGTPPPVKAPVPSGCKKADPVDCATGLFTHSVNDIVISDVMPVMVTRTYRSNDTTSHSFGIGANLSYAMYLYTVSGSTPPNPVNLVQADGSQIHFTLQSGTSLSNAIWTNTDSPTEFHGALLTTDAARELFYLTLRDGTILTFGTHPLNQLQSIRDRNGNVLSITYSSGNITQLTSPNGRYVQFVYDTSNRIISATDNLGRSVGYTYGAPNCAGCLWKVTDMDTNVEQYGYDASSRMTTVTDKRGHVVTTNVYDANSRVSKQTLADNTFWTFTYTLDGNGNVTQSTVTDPRGYIENETFNASGYITQDVHASGQTVQQSFTYQRDATNLVQSMTDPLGRVTAYTYDSFGDVTSMTRLSGTANALTDTFTYSPDFHQLSSYTDPLGHKTTLNYDSSGNLRSVVDPLSHSMQIVDNGQGLPTTISDALSHTTQIAYQQADIASMIDPLGRKVSIFTDGVGRPVNVTDPLGYRTLYSYDGMNRLLQVTDPLNGLTVMTYDPNGNMLTFKDPRNVGTHIYAYDNRDRLQTYTDPLTKPESYVYDGLNNLTKYTDRKAQITQYGYDPLNRLNKVTYQDGSTISIGWDAGNRPTQAVDSINGTVSWQFDLLNHLTQETTPQGVVNYQYDGAGRRTQMTVSGSATVYYCYDSANRLTYMVSGSCSGPTGILTAYGYDNANRRTALTLPNGVVTSYGYDNANELTSLGYASGSTSLGSLTYTYDGDGRRTSRVSGLDHSGAPAAVASASYNAANEVSTWGAQTLTYDANGNMAGDGTNTYTWNARNQLSGISGGVAASFAYDAQGRRRSRTAGGITTSFLYDGVNLARELNGASTIANYLDGLGVDETYSRTDSSSTQSYLTDALGSTIDLTSSAGAITTGYSYDAYGNTTTSGTVSANALQYTGRENDGTGLYFNRARYYNPKVARFIAEDPLGLGAGSNAHAYAGGDPIGLTDPTGLWATDAHNYFLDGLANQFSAQELAWMKSGSATTDDWWLYQDAAHSYMHAMSSSALSKEQALNLYCKFVQDNVQYYEQNHNSSNPYVRRAAYELLGEALHSVMDSTSPAHRGFQRWDSSQIPRHGGFFPSSEEKLSDAPPYFPETLNKMQFVLVFGSAPDCGCN